MESHGVYEKASSVKVNWAKCEVLLVGKWRERAVSILSADLQCERKGLKV